VVKKTFCEKCGFLAEHECQLDIDHIDGNRKNGSLENLQTLCANCHRLKTLLNKDWEDKASP
jgi:ribosomal protein S27AE